MAHAAPRVLDSPEAKPYNIQNLLNRLSRGEIRVPAFQRRIKWDAGDALKLFDSIFRGYPIGTLLFWMREAPEEVLRYGSVRIEASAVSEALWVVDGQQRIHCLARVLLGSGFPEEDFALYFDLERLKFERARRAAPPDHWLPLTEVLDEDRLQEWAFSRRDGLSSDLRQQAFRLGRIIRQFEIPSYAVRTSHESTVREIFSRINSSGKRMETHEVFDAIHGALGGTRPSRMSEIASSLADLGFGAPDEKLLYKMLGAVRGDDIGKPIPSLDPEEAKASYYTLELAARKAALFLREHARIPHISVLPYEAPMIGLSRFFALHPEPSARSCELLSRWVWRGALTGLHSGDITSKRDMLGVIDRDEDQSIQRLLVAIPRGGVDIDLRSFSFRTAAGKLLVLGLLELGPLNLETGAAITIQADVYPDLLQALFTKTPESNLANRVFHPKLEHLAAALASVGEMTVLSSHGITREAHESLRSGDRDRFLQLRLQTLQAAATELFQRRARWGEPDDMPVHAMVIDEDD